MSNIVDFSEAKAGKEIQQAVEELKVKLTAVQRSLEADNDQAGYCLLSDVLESIKNLPSHWLGALDISLKKGRFSVSSNLANVIHEDGSPDVPFLSVDLVDTPLVRVSPEQHNESLQAFKDFILNEVNERPDHRWNYLEIFVSICNHFFDSDYYRIRFEAISETEFSIKGWEVQRQNSHFTIWGNILTRYEGLPPE